MDKNQLITKYWHDVAEQNRDYLRDYFLPQAEIRWHDSNELFTLDEYIIANCEYPSNWQGEVERIEVMGDTVITVTRVWAKDNSIKVHAVSFFKFENDKILALDEYWGECGDIPQWRLDKKIGKKIK